MNSDFFLDTMQGLLEAAAIEYKAKKETNKSVEDCLIIGVDFAPNDTGVMTVMRREGDEVRIINFLKDEEAVKLYNKLIGKSYSICYKCSHHECAWRSDRCDKCEYFESK